ncbi:MAG: hypothetical protein RIS56_2640 [Verrucomicrobiota bacterium]|jgi:hypothetical protein
MRRIYRALNLTAFAESQTLDGIRREEHIDRLWRIISLRGTQKSEALFGHLEPAFHDDRLSLWLRRIAAPIFTPVFTRATLVALVAALAALAAALIITPLLVVTAITSTALAAAALIVALPLMATVSLMVTTMTTSTTTAATLTEATLATARTEGTLMALLTLRPALLGISLKPGGIASTGAGVTRVGAVGRLR